MMGILVRMLTFLDIVRIARPKRVVVALCSGLWSDGSIASILMRLLFIKLKMIGDTLLMTPALDAVKEKYPDASITVLVRRGSEGILAGCPAIDRCLVTAAPSSDRNRVRRWDGLLRLFRDLRSYPFEYIFLLTNEDRSCWLSLVARGRRVINAYRPGAVAQLLCRFAKRSLQLDQRGFHAVERDFRIVSAVLPINLRSPVLRFRAPAPPSEELFPLPHPGGSTVVVHPATRWPIKQWPVDRWQGLLHYLAGRFENLVISVGPGPEEVELGAFLARSGGSPGISTSGNLSWLNLSRLLAECDLFIGVDTAAMHLAAACQCPVLALFGQSSERIWRPWSNNALVLTDPDFETNPMPNSTDVDDQVYGRSMEAISVEAAISAVDQVLGI